MPRIYVDTAATLRTLPQRIPNVDICCTPDNVNPVALQSPVATVLASSEAQFLDPASLPVRYLRCATRESRLGSANLWHELVCLGAQPTATVCLRET